MKAYTTGTNMGKLMISLSDQSESLVRGEVQRVYHGRVGGLSIFLNRYSETTSTATATATATANRPKALGRRTEETRSHQLQSVTQGTRASQSIRRHAVRPL